MEQRPPGLLDQMCMRSPMASSRRPPLCYNAASQLGTYMTLSVSLFPPFPLLSFPSLLSPPPLLSPYCSVWPASTIFSLPAPAACVLVLPFHRLPMCIHLLAPRHQF